MTAIKQFLMRRSDFFRFLFVGFLFILAILTIIPDDAERGLKMPHLTESGFFMHGLAWFVAAFLGFRACSGKTAMLVFLLLYSTALECLQYFIPYRTFNIMDICANMCGLSLWLSLAFLFKRFKLLNQFEYARSK